MLGVKEQCWRVLDVNVLLPLLLVVCHYTVFLTPPALHPLWSFAGIMPLDTVQTAELQAQSFEEYRR